MKKLFIRSYTAAQNGEGVATAAQPLANPTPSTCMDKEYGDAWDSKALAYSSHGEGDMEEATLHFTLACEQFTTIKTSLRNQVFTFDPLNGQEVLVELSEQNRKVIFRYIEVITHLAEMQMKFASYEDAEPNIKEFLQLSKYTNDSTAGDLYNLAVIFKQRYQSDNNIETLLESTRYFISSLFEYKKKPDFKAAEEVVDDVIDNIRLIAIHCNNGKFAFDKLAKDEQRLLKKILVEVLDHEQLLSLANSGDAKNLFFTASKWHYPLLSFDGISETQFKKIQRLQKRLIPDSQDACEQIASAKKPRSSLKRSSRSNSSSPERSDEHAGSPDESTRANKRTTLIPKSDSDNDLVSADGHRPKTPNDMREEIDMKDIDEAVKIALRDALIEFEGTYERTDVKKQDYHLVNSDKELKRVIYVIPPNTCKTPEEVEKFTTQVKTLLMSKNSYKYNSRDVEPAHIVAKMPGVADSVEFKEVKTSANSSKKETVKLAFTDKPVGTVAVVLKSAVYVYEHFNSDLKSMKKSKTAASVKEPQSVGPDFSPAQSNALKIILKTPTALLTPAKPPESKTPLEQSTAKKAKFKFVPVRTQDATSATVKSPPKPTLGVVDSSDPLNTDVFTPENSVEGSTTPQIATKRPGSPSNHSPDLKRDRDEQPLSVTAGHVEPTTTLPATQPGDTKKPKTLTPVPTDPDLVIKEESAVSSYANFLSLFGEDPEVQALLQEKKAEEERARLAAEAAEKARAEVAKIKPELKSVKKESSDLLARARQKLMADLKGEVEAKKREREENEKAQAEAEQRAKAKAHKLEERRKEVEAYKQLESTQANPSSSFK